MPINITVPMRGLNVFQNWANSLNGDGSKYLDDSGQFTTPGGGGSQFVSGTDNPPTAAPSNANLPATYYNTSTKFSWEWDIANQAWSPIPKVYSALLTQSSTDAPVAAVLKNTFGGTLTWQYSNVGIYFLNDTLAEFTANKTLVLMQGVSFTSGGKTYYMEPFYNTTTQIQFYVYGINADGTKTLYNSSLTGYSLRIEVYP